MRKIAKRQSGASPPQQSFLTRISPKGIRREIQSICESYSHSWDILSELAQNSVDAINRWNKENKGSSRDHFIVVEIDQKRGSVTIVDSGCGIDPRAMPQLLAPNETDKEGDEDLIGEKGVGLKFAIFSSDLFEIETRSVHGSYCGTIRNARTWRDGEDERVEALPRIEKEEKKLAKIDHKKTSTTVRLFDLDQFSQEIFGLSPERIAYLLRTKTAIGNTRKRFKKPGPEVDVDLIVTNPDGRKRTKKVPFEYAFPDEFFPAKSVLDLDEFQKRAANLNDAQKAKELFGKFYKIEGSRDWGGRRVNCFAFFAPSRADLDKAAKAKGLFDAKNETYDVKPGIYIATRGMPTGIEMNPPIGGVAGYWENIVMLLEYDNFSFDLGRKTIPGRTQGMLKEIAAEQFGVFRKWHEVRRKSEVSTPPIVEQFERKAEFQTLDKIADLNLRQINYLKHPYEQEAAVVAIFHELVGKGLLPGYYCLASGYKKNYDFWGRYIIDKSRIGQELRAQESIPEHIEQDIVVEFKFEGANIIDDVQVNKKHFEAIDLIVCWDIDENKFRSVGVSVEPLQPSQVFYYGSNYHLEWPGVYGLNRSDKPVLALRRFIEDLKKEK